MRAIHGTPLLVLATTALGACAIDSVHDDSESEGASALRAETAFEGQVASGLTATVMYEPDDPQYPAGVPYLALEVLPGDGASASQTITVEGEFPGSPRLLVVDDTFSVVARGHASSAATTGGTDTAVADLPHGNGRRFVLVRDLMWSRPMEFTVRVSR